MNVYELESLFDPKPDPTLTIPGTTLALPLNFPRESIPDTDVVWSWVYNSKLMKKWAYWEDKRLLLIGWTTELNRTEFRLYRNVSPYVVSEFRNSATIGRTIKAKTKYLAYDVLAS